jgi:hypothetical protein
MVDRLSPPTYFGYLAAKFFFIYYASTSNKVQVMHLSLVIDRTFTSFSNQIPRFFTSCKIGHIHHTSVDYSTSKVPDDSAVIFRFEDEFHSV